MEHRFCEVRLFHAPALTTSNLPFLTCLLPHGTMMTARESPSGKASAFQADIRGFESRLPLLFIGGYRRTGFGPVAQWLAQATHNRLVAGSNPAGPTSILGSALIERMVFEFLAFYKFFQGNTLLMSLSTCIAQPTWGSKKTGIPAMQHTLALTHSRSEDS